MFELLKVLYINFGYDKTFSGSQLTKVFNKYLPHASIRDKANWSHRLRKSGYISVVGATGFNNEYLMRINESKSKNVLLSCNEPQQKDEEVSVGEVGYFIGDIHFTSMEAAVEHCKRTVIQTKRKRIVWEEV